MDHPPTARSAVVGREFQEFSRKEAVGSTDRTDSTDWELVERGCRLPRWLPSPRRDRVGSVNPNGIVAASPGLAEERGLPWVTGPSEANRNAVVAPSILTIAPDPGFHGAMATTALRLYPHRWAFPGLSSFLGPPLLGCGPQRRWRWKPGASFPSFLTSSASNGRTTPGRLGWLQT
jgi:hypothetical protein